MIAYQVPAVMRHLTPVQILDEGVSSFAALGIFAYLASVDFAVSRDDISGLIVGGGNEDILDILLDLEGLQLIEQVQVLDAEVVGEVSA
jgi:hypothetical protein